MQSGKQKRALIMARRQRRSEQQLIVQAQCVPLSRADRLAVDAQALVPFTSYGPPEFVLRGFYTAQPFRCRDCGVEQIWTARAQKWWYETAHGAIYSTAVRCRACREEKRLAPHRSRAERAALAATSGVRA